MTCNCIDQYVHARFHSLLLGMSVTGSFLMVRTNKASSKCNNLAAMFLDRHFCLHELQPLFEIITNGWAAKHPIPSVSLSFSIKKDLLTLFNVKNPKLTPEEALSRIKKMTQYHNDVYVRFSVTAKRIKSLFSRWTSMKKTQNLGINDDLNQEAAGHGSRKDLHSYKELNLVHQLKEEIRKRNIIVDKLWLKKKHQLIDILLKDDSDKIDGLTEEDIDMALAVEENTFGRNTLEPGFQDETTYMGPNKTQRFTMLLIDEGDDDVEAQDGNMEAAEKDDTEGSDMDMQETVKAKSHPKRRACEQKGTKKKISRRNKRTE